MNPKCLACQKKRIHNETEWRIHHPLNRHGFTKEHGFSHPDVKRMMDEEKQRFDPKEPKVSKSIP